MSDRTDRVPLHDIHRARSILERFHRRFPQCLLSVFVAELPRSSSLAEYAFWLANRARFSSVESVEGEDFTLLLVIDAGGQRAALTVGYGLEQHIDEQELQGTLDAFAAAFRKGDLPAGVQACVDDLTPLLREQALALETRPSATKPMRGSPNEESCA